MRTLVTDRRGNPIPLASRRKPFWHKSPLVRSIERQGWHDVVRRAKSHAHEIWYLDEHGNSSLHLACNFNPPTRVVQALGAAVSATNVNGLTPLHVAASHRCNAEALRVLIDLCPTSLRTPSRCGRSPLHYACLSFRGLDLEAFEVLLNATLTGASHDEWCDDGTSGEETILSRAWKDADGSTPLGLLFRRYRERVKSAIHAYSHGNRSEDPALFHSDLRHLWGKAQLIIAKLTEERLQREAYDINAEDDSSLAWTVEHCLLGERKFRIVHASVGLAGYGCPPELIRLAIAMHPQQVVEMDEDGNTPIHIAATASYCKDHECADDDSSIFSLSSLFSAKSPTHDATGSFDKVIRILLRHHPECAEMPHGKSGRLPLTLAMRAGQRTWKDGIRTLVTAYPPALHTVNLGKCYPEALALVSREGHSPPKSSKVEGRPKLFQNLGLSIQTSSNAAAIRRRFAKRRKTTKKVGNATEWTGETSCAGTRHRTVNTLFQLLTTKPKLVDAEEYGLNSL